MSLEFERSDTFRPSLQRDLVAILLWGLWTVGVVSLELESPWNLSGTAFLLVYGAWSWGLLRAAFILLWVGWVFSVFSLMPSALYWLSMMIVYGLLKIAQFRFQIRTSTEFAFTVFFSALLLDLSTYFLLAQTLENVGWSWALQGRIFLSAFLHGFLGYWLWAPLQRWSLAR